MNRRHSAYIQTVFLLTVLIGTGISHATSDHYILRFSDTTTRSSFVANPHMLQSLNTPGIMADAETSKSKKWLKRHGWKQVWPKWFASDGAQPMFAGPATHRYLRLVADDTYYIWSRPLQLDPQRQRYLNITWGIERFPNQAALDVLGRNDRPIVVMVSFGDKVRSAGLRPDVPRALAFFWDESATVGNSYTCIQPTIGDPQARMQCTYPHIKYIALRRGNSGTVYTDQVDLVAHFQRNFPDYWRKHQQVPPIVAVSFEARSDRTASHSAARLYELAFTEQPPQHTTARSLGFDEQSSIAR